MGASGQKGAYGKGERQQEVRHRYGKGRVAGMRQQGSRHRHKGQGAWNWTESVEGAGTGDGGVQEPGTGKVGPRCGGSGSGTKGRSLAACSLADIFSTQEWWGDGL